MTEITIGLDISKDHLEAHRWPDGAAERFGNDHTGHRALIHWIGKLPIGRVVFEPTGPYHLKSIALLSSSRQTGSTTSIRTPASKC